MATYFIRQGGHGAQGPFDEARIAGYIAAGRVRAGMEISPDGQRWMPVEEHRLFASAAPAPLPVPPPLPVAPAVVEAVEEPEEIGESVIPRSRGTARRARGRPAAPSAPAMTTDQATGVGCLALIVICVIGYLVVSRVGPTVTTDSIPGTWKGEAQIGRYGIDEVLIFTENHRYEWYSRFKVEDTWKLNGAGTWSTSTGRYTDTGGEFTQVNFSPMSGTEFAALHHDKDNRDLRNDAGTYRKKSNKVDRPTPVKAADAK